MDVAPRGAAGAQGVPRTQTALWLLRSLRKTSNQWKLKGGCSFFPQNTLLTPFFLLSFLSLFTHLLSSLLFYSPLTLEETT